VLLRDIFRFGTATVLSYCLGPGLGLGSIVALLKFLQPSPPRIDRSLVGVARIVGQTRTTLGAQSGTIVLAQRLER
jgi:xanthosine utilization system XapX-like protein